MSDATHIAGQAEKLLGCVATNGRILITDSGWIPSFGFEGIGSDRLASAHSNLTRPQNAIASGMTSTAVPRHSVAVLLAICFQYLAQTTLRHTVSMA